MVFGICSITQTGLKIDHTLVAKVLTELAVIGVDRHQARVDGVHQNTALATVTGRQSSRYGRR
ncbi:hypothetical protein D3C80_2187550 [compost metagenome]